MFCLWCQFSFSLDRGCCDACWEALPTPNMPFSSSLDYDTAFAAFRYEKPIDYLITQLKFHSSLRYAHWLGKWFLEKYPHTTLPEAIIPVPLHKTRCRERGFNQSIQIAKPIAKKLNLPILRHHVIRHKATKAQSGLTLTQRAKNIKNAFSVQKPISYSHIAILDDVITTGGTVKALSQCLKKAGVKKIDVWAIAKA